MSRRNNEERLGAPHPDSSPPPAVQKDSEDMFSFVVPTEFVDLPSEGKYYAEGHPLCGQTSVEIRHMTAKEEDILTSESLLRKGLAIERLLQALLVNKSIRIPDLLVGDKNALILGARITGYGPFYKTNILCPACADKQEVDFDLTLIKTKESDSVDGIYVSSETKTFSLTLPQSGVEVEVRLMTGRDERRYLELTETKKKKKLPEAGSTDLLKLLIASVNGSSDPQAVSKLIQALPIKDSRYIKRVYESITPDLDMTLQFECSSCYHEGGVPVPLTADFFWPK